MIDLHCHLLPGIDDGSPDLVTSLEMARSAAADGVSVIACTPHMFPGVYNNTGPAVRQAVAALQTRLGQEGIAISLVVGGDVHITPDLVARLKSDRALSLADSRYVLVETPHHVLPPNMDTLFFNVMMAGYVPILTHPERMTWLDRHYEFVRQLARSGVWMQLTAGALVGRFGSRARYWSERMLDEGLFQIIATDAHDATRRPPLLREAYEAACARLGPEEGANLVFHRPQGILENRRPSDMPDTMRRESPDGPDKEPIWRRFLKVWRRG